MTADYQAMWKALTDRLRDEHETAAFMDLESLIDYSEFLQDWHTTPGGDAA